MPWPKYLNLNDWCVPKVIHINQGLSYILSYHGISLWSSMPWPKISKPKWLICPEGHSHQPGPILYPIPMVLNAKYLNLNDWCVLKVIHINQGLSYHGISLWSSMPWPKIFKSKWLMCPQGHPHQPGPILYPILSWHLPMVLNVTAKNI